MTRAQYQAVIVRHCYADTGPSYTTGAPQWQVTLGSALFAPLTMVLGHLVLVPTETGQVHGLSVHNGQTVWSLSLSGAPCNTQAATWPPVSMELDAAGAGLRQERSLDLWLTRQTGQASEVAVVSADGCVHSLRIKYNAEPTELSSCQFTDAETFSAPVLLPNWTAILGSRDDCLHCGQVAGQKHDIDSN